MSHKDMDTNGPGANMSDLSLINDGAQHAAGVIGGNTAAIVSNNGAALITDNGAGVIGNNSGGVIGQNGASSNNMMPIGGGHELGDPSHKLSAGGIVPGTVKSFVGENTPGAVTHHTGDCFTNHEQSVIGQNGAGIVANNGAR